DPRANHKPDDDRHGLTQPNGRLRMGGFAERGRHSAEIDSASPSDAGPEPPMAGASPSLRAVKGARDAPSKTEPVMRLPATCPSNLRKRPSSSVREKCIRSPATFGSRTPVLN